MVLFGKVKKLLGARAGLEEVSHWGQALIVHSLALLPDCGFNVTSQPPAFYTMMGCMPFRYVGINPFFLRFLLVRGLATALRKVAMHKIGAKKWDHCLWDCFVGGTWRRLQLQAKELLKVPKKSLVGILFWWEWMRTMGAPLRRFQRGARTVPGMGCRSLRLYYSKESSDILLTS